MDKSDLEYAQRDTSDKSSTASESANLRFLKVLAAAPGAKLAMNVLVESSGLDPVPSRTALRELRDAHFIAISGPTLDEVVQLTHSGAEVVRLTQN